MRQFVDIDPFEFGVMRGLGLALPIIHFVKKNDNAHFAVIVSGGET